MALYKFCIIIIIIIIINEIGRGITMVTEDNKEVTYLWQRLSMVLQKENAVSFQI